jgi:hypothetical protein
MYARQVSNTNKGRPGKFPREQLVVVDSKLRHLLARETSISVRSFIGQYVSILDFPADVREALERGDVNLFEAHQLARLTARRLGRSEREARSHRRKLLEAHLLKQESGSGLRLRVMEALGELREPDPAQTEIVAVAKADELLEADPLDSSHLFYEELRRIGRTIREVAPEDVLEGDLDALMPLLDQLGTVLSQIEKRKRRKEQEVKRIVI